MATTRPRSGPLPKRLSADSRSLPSALASRYRPRSEKSSDRPLGPTINAGDASPSARVAATAGPPETIA